MTLSEHDNVISMSIVPVVVHYNDTTKDVLTYALLDNCSYGTFSHQDLLSCLGVEGVKVEITVKTLTGEDTEESTMING